MFTKFRSLPSASKRCFFSSGNCAVKLLSASPILSPWTLTVVSPPIYWRSAVGTEIFGITHLLRKNEEKHETNEKVLNFFVCFVIFRLFRVFFIHSVSSSNCERSSRSDHARTSAALPSSTETII